MSTVSHLVQRLRSAAAPGSLLADQSGAAMLTFGLLAPLAFAAVGLGVDAGMWYTQSHRLQATVDFAAVAGAQALARTGDEAGISAAATEAASQNGFVTGSGRTLDVNVDTKPNGTRVVEVIASEPGSRYFSGILLASDPVVRNSGHAEFVPPEAGAFCILGLDPTRAETVEIHGTAEADLNCGVMSNSNDVASVYVAGNGYLSATQIAAFGNIEQGSNATIEGVQQTGAWPVEDPYGPARRDLQPPVSSACDSHNSKVTNKNNKTLSPGRYCGGLKITSSNVTFEPGVYVMDEGDLEVSGNSALTGEGVVFILTGDNPNAIGQVKIPGGTMLDLAAPDATATGAAAGYVGVLFYQDSRAPSFQGANLRTNAVQGGSGDRIEGALYFPAQEVLLTGGASSNDTCLQIIARKVTLQGNAVVRHGATACKELGVSPITPTGVRLVS